MHGLFVEPTLRQNALPIGATTRPRPYFLESLRETVDYAFQPIVNVYDGSVYGYEALLRGYEALGFHSPMELFDQAYRERGLEAVDRVLQEMAFEKFAQIADCSRLRLFFNLDTRTLSQMGERMEETRALLDRLNISVPSVVFELSELLDITADRRAADGVSRCRAERYKIAIDDYGAGYSGLKLLYEHQPDIVKIDRFFISGIADDEKRRLFVSKTVELAHILGVSVVAEGVETDRELATCKEIGCDLAQGYFIARPSTDPGAIVYRSDRVLEVNRRDRRARRRDDRIVREQIQGLPALRITDTLHAVQAAFRNNGTHYEFLPVLDEQGTPVGLVREADLRFYDEAAFGRDLISRKALAKSLRNFVCPCPVADVNAGIDRFLEVFSLTDGPEGVVVVEDFRYIGFLSAASLLRVLNDRNVILAREQNPLTRLPGNNLVNDYIGRALEASADVWTFAYFDFDNFKPFNDTYGFRQGDRAILLFAELMAKRLKGKGSFIGHVGGDDFFAGFRNLPLEQVIGAVEGMVATFSEHVRSLYDPDTRRRGHVVARGAGGGEACFPMLECGAVVVQVAGPRGHGSVDDLTHLVAALKAQSKLTTDRLVMASLA